MVWAYFSRIPFCAWDRKFYFAYIIFFPAITEASKYALWVHCSHATFVTWGAVLNATSRSHPVSFSCLNSSSDNVFKIWRGTSGKNIGWRLNGGLGVVSAGLCCINLAACMQAKEGIQGEGWKVDPFGTPHTSSPVIILPIHTEDAWSTMSLHVLSQAHSHAHAHVYTHVYTHAQTCARTMPGVSPVHNKHVYPQRSLMCNHRSTLTFMWVGAQTHTHTPHKDT